MPDLHNPTHVAGGLHAALDFPEGIQPLVRHAALPRKFRGAAAHNLCAERHEFPAVVMGEPAYADTSAVLKSMSHYLQTVVAETADMWGYFVVQPTGDGLSGANRACFVGNGAGVSAVDSAKSSTGLDVRQDTGTGLRLRANWLAPDGTPTFRDATCTYTVGEMALVSFRINGARQTLWNHTRGNGTTNAPPAGWTRNPCANAMRIGSHTEAFFGSCRMFLGVIGAGDVDDALHAAMVADVRAKAALDGWSV